MPSRRRRTAGMTLVEIIVVIGIILLLLGLLIPAAGALWRAVMALKLSTGHH